MHAPRPSLDMMRVRKDLILFFVVVMSFVCLIGIRSYTHSNTRSVTCKVPIYRNRPSVFVSEEREQESGRRFIEDTHPFENSCKFPILQREEVDISGWGDSGKVRKLDCDTLDYDPVIQDSDGCIYVSPNQFLPGNTTKDVSCYVSFLEGGLRRPAENKTANHIELVAETLLTPHKRLLLNSDAFVIKCNMTNNKNWTWERTYAGLRDLRQDKNKVFNVSELPHADEYGRARAEKRPPRGRLSVDILAFDSTSRNQFTRVMPRSMEVMNRLGFQQMYGYNKVGENSAINLIPLLAGDLPEALKNPKYDSLGFINKNHIMPTNESLDPSKIEFIWKLMKKNNCTTLFNDDVMHTSRGLFHYPGEKFLGGFTESPTDHYYRNYYVSVYNRWKNQYKVCYDGRIVQEEFMDIWRRFSATYTDVCHFGFTFIASLTHDMAHMLSVVDEKLASSLAELEVEGALDNSVLVVMGDHGNRISTIRYSHTGRIEDRMPLMSIRLPLWFRNEYPQEYQNFLDNKWRLTTNFDVHQTLKDIANMRFGDAKKEIENSGRGISLFDVHPTERSCEDAYIATGLCACLEDRSELDEPRPKHKVDAKKREEAVLTTIKTYLRDSHGECVDESTVKLRELRTLGVNPLVRQGIYDPEGMVESYEKALNNTNNMNFLYHEADIFVKSKATQQDVQLTARVQQHVDSETYRANFEPLVVDGAGCEGRYLARVCACLAE